jgi:alpha-galactosidase
MEILRKLIPPTGQAANFADETLTVGRAPHGRDEYLYLFNYGDTPGERVVKLSHKVSLKNYWTGEQLGKHEGEYRVSSLAPHTAMLLVASAPDN